MAPSLLSKNAVVHYALLYMDVKYFKKGYLLALKLS
jgi:hypothetical protein